ncbi:unnamed protein product [Amoebophrya sp. A120]|nr:unnamed protein product [Amoebophrya sp. A120]|eukprot:GSA120T00011125001.1
MRTRYQPSFMSTILSSRRTFASALPRLSNQVSPPPPATNTKLTSNIPSGIREKIGRTLHETHDHPLFLVRKIVERHFVENINKDFALVSAPLNPVVTVAENFDNLLIPKGHSSRLPNDTYYEDYDQGKCLRTHTTTHEPENYWRGKFLLTGDVYRRDEIDRTHFPVFHQMEGVKLFEKRAGEVDHLFLERIQSDLRHTCESTMRHLFGHQGRRRDHSSMEFLRWSDDYFPFTSPSFELEVKLSKPSSRGEISTDRSSTQSADDPWLEVLGCGILRPEVLAKGHVDVKRFSGWAFGFGLERLAMLLFQIPDIRLFWSHDERFLEQFHTLSKDLEAGGEKWREVEFKPFSKYPAIAKDLSFWLPALEAAGEKNLGGVLRSSEKAEGEGRDNGSTNYMSRSDVKPAVQQDLYTFPENDFFETIREEADLALPLAGDDNEQHTRSDIYYPPETTSRSRLSERRNLVESVRLISDFTHPKTNRRSKTYRIVYQDMSRTLTHEEVNEIQNRIVARVTDCLGVCIR